MNRSSKEIMVSILVLTYNQKFTILQALESTIQQQTNFEYEILIGDDCSTDGTTEICANFKETYTYKNITVITAAENAGVIKNFTKLTLAASGKYMTLLAGDDYWIDDHKLQKQYDFLEANSDCGLVHTNYNIFYESENLVKTNDLKRMEGDLFDVLIIANQIGSLTAMFKKDLSIRAIESGIYNNGFLMEDYPLWLYIALYSRIGYIDEVTAVWRMLNESISNSKSTVKNIIFDNSVLQVQTYFATKSAQSATVLKHLTSIHHRHLMLAYIHQIDVVGHASFRFLKKNKALKITDVKNYLGILFPLPFKLLRKIKSTMHVAKNG
jgi:glycosyltransferase involved in cell wall biosynthesis